MGRKPAVTVQVFSNLGVRLDPDLREDVKQQAALAGLSLNQYAADALAYYNGLQRARRDKQDQLELVK